MKKLLVPEIRFKDITEAWEQRTLDSLCIIEKGEQINKETLFEQGEYYVLNGGISPSGYINKYNTMENTISVYEGGNSCGYVTYNNEKFWSGGHNYTLKSLKCSTKFLYQQLKKLEYYIMNLRLGSGLPNIQRCSLIKVCVNLPNSEEQELVSLFLFKIDSLIFLHQSKYEKLQNIKKSLLNKMFV